MNTSNNSKYQELRNKYPQLYEEYKESLGNSTVPPSAPPVPPKPPKFHCVGLKSIKPLWNPGLKLSPSVNVQSLRQMFENPNSSTYSEK